MTRQSNSKVTQSLQDFNLRGSTGDNITEKNVIKTGLQVGPLSAFTPEIIEIINKNFDINFTVFCFSINNW